MPLMGTLSFRIPCVPHSPKATTTQYRLETVSRACRLLRHFTKDHPSFSLKELAESAGIERTICFRLLHTLEQEGFVRRIDKRHYVSNLRILSATRFRIGYASQSRDSFSSALSQGLHWAASEMEMDLVELDNQYSARTAVRNAEALVKQKVDLAIEFQVFDKVGPRISQIFQAAGVPFIAVEIPHPGATFFGVDNFKAGVLAGKHLLKAAQHRWHGECSEVLLLDLGIAGSLPALRMAGAESVLSKGLSGSHSTFHIDSRGQFVNAFELTRKHLQFAPRRRTLLAGVNDSAVMGALRAFEEIGRRDLCMAVGLGAIREARQELRLPNSPLIASVAFFPERYGEGLLRLALDLLQKRDVPPAIYVPIQLLYRNNVDQLYPEDLFDMSGQC